MKKENLSMLDINLYTKEIINFCLDNRIDTIINDLKPIPQVEYSLDDLYIIWDNLKKTK